MKYTLEFTSRARRDIRKLPRDVKPRVYAAALALADDPRPQGYLKTKGEENEYRIRVGEYRVIYSIYDNILTVEVIAAGHRSSVYRKP